MNPCTDKRAYCLVLCALMAATAARAAETPRSGRRPDGPPRQRHPVWGIGTGLRVRTPVYEGEATRFLPLPFVSYRGDRLQILGPVISYRLWSGGPAAAALVAAPAFDGYDTGDTHAVTGMDDRHPTLHAGASLRMRGLPWRTTLGLAVYLDALDVHDGGEAIVELDTVRRMGRWMLTPAAGLRWQSAELTNYYYGVRSSEARPGRPAYAPGHSWTLQLGMRVIRAWNPRWSSMLNLGVDVLDDAVRDSPIVDADVELGLMIAAVRSL